MFIVLVNDGDGVMKDLLHIGVDLDKAQVHFLDACKTYISNWDEYSPDDIEDLLTEGSAEFGLSGTIPEPKVSGAVMLIDTSNCVSDQKIREMLAPKAKENSEEPKVYSGRIVSGVLPITVAKVYYGGELTLEPGMDMDQVLEECGDNLSAALAWEIQGTVLFEGSDGQLYTVVTESAIELANQAFAEQLIEDYKKAGGT